MAVFLAKLANLSCSIMTYVSSYGRPFLEKKRNGLKTRPTLKVEELRNSEHVNLKKK